MKTNVKNYKDKEILRRIKSLKEYKGIPKDFYMVFVRSTEDEVDRFDDKVYLFEGETFHEVTSCTTNPGLYGLLNYSKWNKYGTAVLEFDRAYYDGWKKGYHKGKVKGWVQNKKVTVFRDNNKNKKSEEIGKKQDGFFGINIHTVTYKWINNIIKSLIGKWSVGCLVFNNTKVFRTWFEVISRKQSKLTVFLLNEF